MDISQLANSVTVFLTPFLPYLLKAGEKAFEEAGKKFGSDAWDRAKGLWNKLLPRVESNPVMLNVVQKAVGKPEDKRVLAALELQIEDILQDDLLLADEVAKLVGAGSTSNTAIATGDRSIAVGGDITDSNIITGDRNIVQAGKRNKSSNN